MARRTPSEVAWQRWRRGKSARTALGLLLFVCFLASIESVAVFNSGGFLSAGIHGTSRTGSSSRQRRSSSSTSQPLLSGQTWSERGWTLPRVARSAAGDAKELDSDAVIKYFAAILIQMSAIAAFFYALDAAVKSLGVAVPEWAVFGLFFGMSIRSRIFSPLDNSRPNIDKAVAGKSTGGFNDRKMPGWTPPGIFFPIMWILIVAPLRATASLLVWQQVGHLCDATLLVLMFHLSIGDTWNTVNNVERRLGAAVPGVLCVWASALLAAFAYSLVLPFAGQVLLPTCLWLTVAAALVTDTWRINSQGVEEPLFPYRGSARTEFWFLPAAK
mmetsp:Transcript_64299/g.127169  ORF Transcript_64299/g.127169 Transcript_64299/m.127169 type:complete len:329 (-) Transcript_64299:157-1143(-)|eukprot:CAMPEP_0172722520 /NCGR_PEP_ID=MMETSP1074-20121228/81684_1 /TAXON_ID=2916 /ORGANISM="Ceratium fusus, Strain PA161109" /LENGTH=328 /DNA_ID=CAMNT_0013548549 /DNA_START=16 /DNA_END=1002 /DNA_ORIENTATION=+